MLRSTLRTLSFGAAVAAALTVVGASKAQAQCSDQWVTEVVTQLARRAPRGSGQGGECRVQNYGGGHWSDKQDLTNKVRAYLFNTAIATESRKCLIPAGDYENAEVQVRPCAQGGATFMIDNGYVMTASGRCLDFGGQGRPIVLVTCKAGRPERTSQQWYFHGNKLAQSALQAATCMDVEGGVNGRRVLAWKCNDFNRPSDNQRFYVGGAFPLLSLASSISLPMSHQTTLRNGGFVSFSNGGFVVAAGGGNVVAAGGLNVIAPGGGNVVAAGGLNLRVVPDPSELFRGASVVAAGGLN